MDKGSERCARQYDEVMEQIVEHERLAILQHVRERNETSDMAYQ